MTKGKRGTHKFNDATCTEPKRCETCPLEEGDPLGHERASCEYYDTSKMEKMQRKEVKCKVCGTKTSFIMKLGPERVNPCFLDITKGGASLVVSVIEMLPEKFNALDIIKEYSLAGKVGSTIYDTAKILQEAKNLMKEVKEYLEKNG